MKPFTFLAIILLGVAIFTAPITAQNSVEAAPVATVPVIAAPVEAAPAPVEAAPFADVPPNHWAAAAVRKLAELGILIGYPEAPKMAKKVQSKSQRTPRAAVSEKAGQ